MTSIPQAGIVYGARSQQMHSLLDGDAATYSVATSGLSGLANGSLLLQMAGNASNVVRITRVEIYATGTAGVGTVSLQRFSTTATGGSPSGFQTSKNDINDPAAASSLVYYTAAPTGGIPLGGNVRVGTVAIAAATLPAVLTAWDFGEGPKKGLILRGTSDFMCLQLVSGFSGNTLNISWEWTESAT
jgi:hypothetical protein